MSSLSHEVNLCSSGGPPIWQTASGIEDNTYDASLSVLHESVMTVKTNA